MADGPDVPTSQVKQMRNKGISDDKIVERLQRDGYKSSQIFDAMTQADMEPAQEATDVTDDFPDIMHRVKNRSSPAVGAAENTEELIESIIDEKWEEIEENVRKIVDWKNETEQRIDQIEQDVERLEDKFEKLHRAIAGKVGEYDQNILNVGAEIEAMEKAFSKMLPKFSESVNELSDIVKDLKDDKQQDLHTK